MGTKRWNKLSIWLIIIELVVAFTVILIGKHTFADRDQTKKNKSYEVKSSKVSKKNHETVEKSDQEEKIKTTNSNDTKVENPVNPEDQQQNPVVTTIPAKPASDTQNAGKSLAKTLPKNTTQNTGNSTRTTTKTTKAPTTKASAPKSSTPSATKPTTLPTESPEPTTSRTTDTQATNQEQTNTSEITTPSEPTEPTESSGSVLTPEQQSQLTDSATTTENPVLNN